MTADIYKRRVKDIMSTDVVSVHPQDTVHDALELMVENRVSALPVVDRQMRCVGILSTSDLIDVTRDLDVDMDGLEDGEGTLSAVLVRELVDNVTHERIDELMTNDVASVHPDTLLASAASQMLRDRVHRLPVLDNNQRLLGIISTMDILAAFVDGAPA